MPTSHTMVDVRAPIWVGHVEMGDPAWSIDVRPAFTAASLLVTVGGVPLGRVTVPLVGGRADAATVRDAITAELGDEPTGLPAPLPVVTRPITVVVATRGRSDSLARCVTSLLKSDHAALTVLVVDNDPSDDRTAAAVRGFGDPRVRYVREERRGASNGRNRGLREAIAADADLVAFTDDDVEVDPGWVGRMASALSEPGVSCVCGPVIGARLDTAAQLTADEALGWRKGWVRRRFSMAEPPAESAIFPFSPGLFGVGANMAVDAAVAQELGGFDPALGPGTPARGGEDCEFLIRLVLAGHTLSYEPSAFLWHHHRPTADELADQMDGYTLGLGAFLGKIMLDPVARAAAARRFPAALRQLVRISRRESTAEVPGSAGLRKARALAAGPAAYLRSRKQVREAGGVVPPLTIRP